MRPSGAKPTSDDLARVANRTTPYSTPKGSPPNSATNSATSINEQMQGDGKIKRIPLYSTQSLSENGALTLIHCLEKVCNSCSGIFYKLNYVVLSIVTLGNYHSAKKYEVLLNESKESNKDLALAVEKLARDNASLRLENSSLREETVAQEEQFYEEQQRLNEVLRSMSTNAREVGERTQVQFTQLGDRFRQVNTVMTHNLGPKETSSSKLTIEPLEPSPQYTLKYAGYSSMIELLKAVSVDAVKCICARKKISVEQLHTNINSDTQHCILRLVVYMLLCEAGIRSIGGKFQVILSNTLRVGPSCPLEVLTMEDNQLIRKKILKNHDDWSPYEIDEQLYPFGIDPVGLATLLRGFTPKMHELFKYQLLKFIQGNQSEASEKEQFSQFRAEDEAGMENLKMAYNLIKEVAAVLYVRYEQREQILKAAISEALAQEAAMPK